MRAHGQRRRGRSRGAPRTRDGPHIDRGQPLPSVPVLRAQSEDLISGPSTALAPLRPARSQATRPSRLFRAESLQRHQSSAPGARLRLLEPIITTAWTATADGSAYPPNSRPEVYAVLRSLALSCQRWSQPRCPRRPLGGGAWQRRSACSPAACGRHQGAASAAAVQRYPRPARPAPPRRLVAAGAERARESRRATRAAQRRL